MRESKTKITPACRRRSSRSIYCGGGASFSGLVVGGVIPAVQVHYSRRYLNYYGMYRTDASSPILLLLSVPK